MSETQQDVFVQCVSTCGQCAHQGSARVWQYAHETEDETTRRHQRETRERCVAGCRYTATPPVKEP